jgi:hypothetical protein
VLRGDVTTGSGDERPIGEDDRTAFESHTSLVSEQAMQGQEATSVGVDEAWTVLIQTTVILDCSFIFAVKLS